MRPAFKRSTPHDLPSEGDVVIDERLLDPAVGLGLGVHVFSKFQEFVARLRREELAAIR
jgi:hypothetical protein